MAFIIKLKDYVSKGMKRQQGKPAYTESDDKLYRGIVLPENAPYKIEIEQYGDKKIYKMFMDC